MYTQSLVTVSKAANPTHCLISIYNFSAQLVDRNALDEDDDYDDYRPTSYLRSKTALILEDEDERYAGKRTSRKTLQTGMATQFSFHLH